MVSTSAANAKSMGYVQSIVACWSRIACPACLRDYHLDISLDSPESGQYTTHYVQYRMRSDKQIGVMQWNISFLPLGKILLFGKYNSNNIKAPESLAGCPHVRPQGFYVCVSSLIVQVRPPVVPGFQL